MISDNIKMKVRDEFDEVLRLMNLTKKVMIYSDAGMLTEEFTFTKLSTQTVHEKDLRK